jgi:hypothetical protein
VKREESEITTESERERERWVIERGKTGKTNEGEMKRRYIG